MTTKDYSGVEVAIRLWDGEIIEVDLDTLMHYGSCCAMCRWFRGAYSRKAREDRTLMWVDDDGWCIRHPPVFVGGEYDGSHCGVGNFAQPVVVGADTCGEYEKGWDFHRDVL